VIRQPSLAGALVDEVAADDARLGEPVRLVERGPDRPARLSGRCAALAAAPAVLDLACARAATGAGMGIAIAHVGAAGLAVGPALAAAAARRGFLALVATCDGHSCTLTLGEDRDGSVAMTAPLSIAGPAAAALLDGRFDPETVARALEDSRHAATSTALALACVAPSEAARALRSAIPCEAAGVTADLISADREGVIVPEEVFRALERLSARLYVPPDIEPYLRDEVIDPLTTF
jgi:hypothetical protein